MKTGTTVLVSIITSAITSVLVVLGLQAMQGGSVGDLGGKGSVQIPSVTNLEPEQARVLLENSGLFLVISDSREDPKVEAGRIMQQNPLPGSWIKKGTSVNVVLSTGKGSLQVPGLTGLSLNDAMQKLTENGLRVGAVNRKHSDSVPLDSVIASIPVTGSSVATGTPVNLVVSDGKGAVAVPNVMGKRHRAALEEIEKAGLKVGRVRYGYDEDRRGGVVIGQSPRGDTEVEPGSSIDLVVNETD
jgi:serine/threonine-protein kinase